MAKKRMNWPEGSKRSTYYLNVETKRRLEEYANERGFTMTFVLNCLVAALPESMEAVKGNQKARKIVQNADL